MRISDWSSDVCSSDLSTADQRSPGKALIRAASDTRRGPVSLRISVSLVWKAGVAHTSARHSPSAVRNRGAATARVSARHDETKQNPCALQSKSEEHTSELQSLMRISYAVFCLKKKQTTH